MTDPHRVTSYRIRPPAWGGGPGLRIAILADIHACNPWMGLGRIGRIVEETNALDPDLVLLLGDYEPAVFPVLSKVDRRELAGRIAGLTAPLGVFGVLGNHDWEHDREARRRGSGPVAVGAALAEAGVGMLENQAVRLEKDGRGFWVAGLGSQLAISLKGGRRNWRGVDDLPATMAQIDDNAPVLLMAHEPDIFPQVTERVALTVSGHTHGGQVNLFGWMPMVPSRFGARYAYGHVVEEGRHLVVSGGLGYSLLPLRFMRSPEIVMLELS